LFLRFATGHQPRANSRLDMRCTVSANDGAKTQFSTAARGFALAIARTGETACSTRRRDSCRPESDLQP